MEAGSAYGGAGARSLDGTEVVGRRIGATLIDGLIWAVVFFVLGLATGGGHSGHGSVGVKLSGGAFLLFLALWIVYYTLFEGSTGQTPGKKALGIRVVRLDGSPAGYGAALVRTVLRLVDVLPVFYIVGLVSILATGERRRQRVGDLAAGTTVVGA